jgi:hypothetical protein
MVPIFNRRLLTGVALISATLATFRAAVPNVAFAVACPTLISPIVISVPCTGNVFGPTTINGTANNSITIDSGGSAGSSVFGGDGYGNQSGTGGTTNVTNDIVVSGNVSNNVEGGEAVGNFMGSGGMATTTNNIVIRGTTGSVSGGSAFGNESGSGGSATVINIIAVENGAGSTTITGGMATGGSSGGSASVHNTLIFRFATSNADEYNQFASDLRGQSVSSGTVTFRSQTYSWSKIDVLQNRSVLNGHTAPALAPGSLLALMLLLCGAGVAIVRRGASGANAR